MKHTIILASGSPRRREIMDRIGAVYTIIPSDKDEDMSEHNPSILVEGLARMKAGDVASKVLTGLADGTYSDEYGHSVVIGCDTVVAYSDKVLGKPHSDAEAFTMIHDFQGRSHQVYTGVCLVIIEEGRIVNTINYHVTTNVNVFPMTDDEINAYIATGETADKAGAYAIQGRFCPFIESIEGDYYNIVGYPISSIYHKLKEINISLF